MADFTALKTAIQTYIKENGNEEITGEKLQEILLSVVTTLGDSAINDLVTALANEVAARQNADGTLQQNITNEATARGNADTALGGRIDDEATARANGDTALSDRLGSSITAENTAADQIGAEAEARTAADTALLELIDGITDNIENGYVYAGIATPSSTPATGKVFYLALTAGTYTNFGSTEVSQGINILKYNGSAWSLDAFIGIDDELTPGSNNIPKSGNVLENIIKNGSAFDLSAYNAVDGVPATYADLDAALAALNLLPAVYKQPGMSFRFVLTADNKYVQARCMADTFSTDVADWQGVDTEPTSGSHSLVESGGVYNADRRIESKILYTPEVLITEHTFSFNIQVQQGHTYYVKHISGYGNGAAIKTSSRDEALLSTGTWVEFVAENTAQPYIYILTPEGNETPVVMFADAKGVYQEIVRLQNEKLSPSDIVNNLTTTEGGKVLDARQGKVLADLIASVDSKILYRPSVSNPTAGAYMYNIVLQAGHKYYVKHISGDGNGKNFYVGGAAESQITLVTGAWVEYIPTVSGNPYTYQGTKVSNPVVEVADADGVYKELVNLQTEIAKTEGEIVKTDNQLYTNIPITFEKGGINSSGAPVNSEPAYSVLRRAIIPLDDVELISFSVQLSNNLFAYYAFYDSLWGNVVGSVHEGSNVRLEQTINKSEFPQGAAYFVVSGSAIHNNEASIKQLKTSILEKRIEDVENDTINTTILYAERGGDSNNNDETHFYGLTAIADALNSITDASNRNRYIIVATGKFIFTDPRTVPMGDGKLAGGVSNEYSIINGKDYVDIEGVGMEKTVLAIDFEYGNVTFHDTVPNVKTYSYQDYQPVYWNCNSKLSNMSIYARNCRYCVHFEGNNEEVNNKPHYMENLYVEHLGNEYTGGGGYDSAFGTGIHGNQHWVFNDCILKSDIRNASYLDFGAAFACHTPTNGNTAPSIIDFNNCAFYGHIVFHDYLCELNICTNIVNCEFVYGTIKHFAYHSGNKVDNAANMIKFPVFGQKLSALYANRNITRNLSGDFNYGLALKITSSTTGSNSKVRFNTSASAFGLIVGNADGFESMDLNCVPCIDGYSFRDGCDNIAGYAYGSINLDPEVTNFGLGKRLGDCSMTNKTLIIIVDGVSHTVTFNEDYSSQTNDYVISAINSQLDGYAIASLYSPCIDYYPMINGFKLVESSDSTPILKGMGIIIETGKMRKAKNSDGYIDGVCLDDIAPGQKGRIITQGQIFSAGGVFDSFRLKETTQTASTVGQKAGISTTDDGVFDKSATPELVRCKQPNVWDII